MNSEYWVIERYVDLGNEKFWHEVARLLRRRYDSTEEMKIKCQLIGERDVTAHGARYRIVVETSRTIHDSHGEKS